MDLKDPVSDIHFDQTFEDEIYLLLHQVGRDIPYQ